MPFFPFVSWLLLVWLLGWLALPFARRIWGRDAGGLPDAGLAAGRVLLLMFWTLLSFWAGNAGLPTRLSAFLIVPLGAICCWLARRDWPALQAVVCERRRGILVSEAVFLTVFLLFFTFRGFWPDINNGEKPMDMALIAACARADWLPPANPYASGERLNSYYYLGHLQTALLTNAIGSVPRWTYNLMCATLPALCFSSLFALCGAVTGRLRNGAAAATCILALGTLEPLRQWLFPPPDVPRRTWPLDYFSTSRVVPFMAEGRPHFTINEYPWFTFNYADLHAHYFAMPLVLLLLTLGWAVYGRMAKDGELPKGIALLSALTLGALAVTNTWDYPAYTLFTTLCLLAVPSARQLGAGLITAVAVALLALLAASPFLLYLHSEANPPRWLEQPASPAGSWLLMWGPIVGAWILALILAHKKRARKSAWERWSARLAIALPGVLWLSVWLITGYRTVQAPVLPALPSLNPSSSVTAAAPVSPSILNSGQNYFVIILLVTLTLWTAREVFRKDDPVYAWLCRLALCGLLALCWSETTWAGFLGPPYHRQDTVFKFGLQAWYLLGLAAVCGAARMVSYPSLPEKGTIQSRAAWRQWPWELRLVFALMLPVMATSSVATTWARLHHNPAAARLNHGMDNVDLEQPLTFQGWDAWLHLAAPERAAAEWLQSHARDGDTLIEAEMKEGGDYTQFPRYAHATGVPTVVGPSAHTFQWGTTWKSVFRRKDDVRAFYTLTHDDIPWQVLQQYNVRYIITGELERREYGAPNVARVERMLNQRLILSADAEDDPEHQVKIFYMNKGNHGTRH